MASKSFIDKIYAFSYKRCDSSADAADLCSDIILAIITSLGGEGKIENFDAYTLTVARRVYADFCEKRKHRRETLSLGVEDNDIPSHENEIEAFIEKSADRDALRRIFKEISFLSKAYRDVMIMHYIDEMKVSDIANRLSLSETTVKQRLFYARNSIRKEVYNMNERNLTLKPTRLFFAGTGSPNGNDPSYQAQRALSQNLIYACKERPKTAKELSEELGIPMLYIEEELEFQVYGVNGVYGTLRRLDNGKYAPNILIADYAEWKDANSIVSRHLPEILATLRESLKKHESDILGMPFMSKQDDIGFILWSIMSFIAGEFDEFINKALKADFEGIVPSKRPYTLSAVALGDDAKEHEEEVRGSFVGNDGIMALSFCGYKSIRISNLYGKVLDKHFWCGYDLANDEKIIMLVRSVGGLPLESLSEKEKEIAAKCIECGYIRKVGDVLEPRVVTLPSYDVAFDIAEKLAADLECVAKKIAKELAAFTKSHIPEYLYPDYGFYSRLIATNKMLADLIDACIKEGILTRPEGRIAAEGVVLTVEK